LPWLDAVKSGRADCKRQGVSDYSSRGNDCAGHRANRSWLDPDRKWITLEQKALIESQNILPQKSACSNSLTEEKNFVGSRSAGAGREKGARGAGTVLLEINWNESSNPPTTIEMAPACTEHGLAALKPRAVYRSTGKLVPKPRSTTCSPTRKK